MIQPTCPHCKRPISPADTIGFDDHNVVHLDCDKPCDLSPEERDLLFTHCWHTEITECGTCKRTYRRRDLYADFFGQRAHRCPGCRADITESLRAHLHTCVLVPTKLRQTAKEARAASRDLVQRSQQLVDESNGLMRDAQAAIAASRQTVRRSVAQDC